MSWLGAILAISFLIVVHEAGHLLVARWCQMRVERFSIGFGPAVASVRSKKTGTIFQIAPIPFGGFVEIKGMNIAEEVDPDDIHAYPNRPAWQRFVTIFAGPATNYLTAIVLALTLYGAFGIKSAERWFGVYSMDPAYDAKRVLQEDDRLLALNGKPLWMVSPTGEAGSLQKTIAATQPHVAADVLPPDGAPGVPLTLTIQRAGKQLDVQITPRFDGKTEDEHGKKVNIYRLGIVFQEQYDRLSVGPVGVVGAAFRYPIDQTIEISTGLYQVITGQVKGDVKGPVGMASIIKRAFSTGIIAVLELMMLLNVYLGLFNLLPLPALDGGRLVFLGYEMATRRRANPKVETTVHMVGILILAVVMVLVTFRDCVNL
ncbi:MAG: site-2 protease family protein [Deltaproteobacteria bacterium]|nr:site-2 protease family protein [Deltaproteobacteria bacterium]